MCCPTQSFIQIIASGRFAKNEIQGTRACMRCKAIKLGPRDKHPANHKIWMSMGGIYAME